MTLASRPVPLLKLRIPKDTPSELREFLREITPATTAYEEKFSANLARWIVKQITFDKLTTIPGVFHKKNDPSDIFVACYDRGFDEDLAGSRLRSIISLGSAATTGLYAGMRIRSLRNITDEFWNEYRQRGKCAIDPTHSTYGCERWEEDAKGAYRTCRWCGLKQKAVHRVIKTVTTDWVDQPGRPAIKPAPRKSHKRA
jgi:hypothetical protein